MRGLSFLFSLGETTRPPLLQSFDILEKQPPSRLKNFTRSNHGPAGEAVNELGDQNDHFSFYSCTTGANIQVLALDSTAIKNTQSLRFRGENEIETPPCY